MGCQPSDLSVKQGIPNMEKRYQDERLPQPSVHDYKTDFERDFFMMVNLMRSNPLSFVTYVKAYATQASCSNPQACKTVEGVLKSLGNLKPCQLEGVASNACYVNLTKNIDERADQLLGGAVQEYAHTTSRNKSDYDAVDSTKKNWSGTPLSLLIEMLVMFYSVPSNAKKTHSLLADNLVAIGSAIITHKKFSQVFQVLYIKSKVSLSESAKASAQHSSV